MFLRAFITLVWLANGLYAKLLDGVPRHQEIVARLFGEAHSLAIIRVIGLAEIVMALWVWSLFHRRFCAVTQIAVVTSMNVIEFCATRDLLLWGPWNAVFAALFCVLVFFHGFRSR